MNWRNCLVLLYLKILVVLYLQYPVFLFIEPSGEVSLACSWASQPLVGLVCPGHVGCSISPVALFIGPAQEYRVLSGTSWSMVGLVCPGHAGCSISQIALFKGPYREYSFVWYILVHGWTSWYCYNRWVVLTGRYEYNPETTGDESLKDTDKSDDTYSCIRMG